MGTSNTTLTLAQWEAILNAPAIQPPPGVQPNLVNPPNLLPAVITVIILCLGLTTTAILIRMYTKLFLMRSLAYEDGGSRRVPL